MSTTFYSNGKILITSEYLVIDGAMALAIPTVYGQSLEVKVSTENALHWKSFDLNNHIWFEGKFQIDHALSIISTSHTNIAQTLQKILVVARKLNPHFLVDSTGFNVITRLDFPKNWGLGSSSTLINNIAQWANVNAYKLLDKSFGGSGYDIACAQSDVPLIYKKTSHRPLISYHPINWPFKDELFFVYLNQKKDSKEAIAQYKNIKKNKKSVILYLNEITKHLLHSKSLTEFELLIELHENAISNFLDTLPIKTKLFNDYPGMVKSLGAWGGDFVLVTRNDALTYFPAKGYTTIISFKEIIK